MILIAKWVLSIGRLLNVMFECLLNVLGNLMVGRFCVQ